MARALAATGRASCWLGSAGYTFYQLGFVLGLERTSPFASSLLIAMVPLFTLVMLALRGERTPLRGWAGLALALVGVTIFLADQLERAARWSLIGDLLSLGAAVSFALYGVVNRPLVRDYPPETYTAYTLLAGSLPLMLIGAPAALAQDWGAVSSLGWLEIVYMVVLPVYVAYMIWNWAIARRGAASHQLHAAGADRQRRAFGLAVRRAIRPAETAGRGAGADGAGDHSHIWEASNAIRNPKHRGAWRRHHRRAGDAVRSTRQRFQRGLEDLVEVVEPDVADGLFDGLLGLRELVAEVLERADRVLDGRGLSAR